MAVGKHKCSGCKCWMWHPKDTLYGTPGFHQCTQPQYCERFKKTKIKRNSSGFITDETLADMQDKLPIEVFANFDLEPHRTISTKQELEDYLFGALPYALTTYYRKKPNYLCNC